MLSGSVLYSARVILYKASGLTPKMKSSWIAFSFPGHPESVTSSPSSILCSPFVNCRNRSNHRLAVNTAFPSEALASRFGTMFFSALKNFVQFKNWLTAPCCVLWLWYNKTRTSKVGAISKVKKTQTSWNCKRWDPLGFFSKSNLLRGVTSQRSDIVCWDKWKRLFSNLRLRLLLSKTEYNSYITSKIRI